MRPDVFRLRPWQRHSLVLVVAGFVYIMIGLNYLAVPLTEDRALGLTLALHLTQHSIAPWGLAWIIVGLLALVSTRWPPASKTWGYTGLTAMATAWSCFYLYGVVVYDTPRANLSGVFVWALVAFVWWAISGLVNPDDVPTVDPLAADAEE